MEVVGKIKVIDAEKEVGNAGFKKRDVVVATDEQYPQSISIQFVQDKCEYLDNFKVGDLVTVGINLRGREWSNPLGETVYINTIQGWRITKQDTSKQSPAETPNTAKTKTNPKEVAQDDAPDDLPF